MRTEMVPISDRARSSRLKLDALFVGVLGLGLYWATLAPTVLWSDGGHLQLNAVRGLLQGSAGSHPVWVWVAHQFTKIPFGDVAGRVNLVSAVSAALTLGLFYLLSREISVERVPSLLATLALALSHTFWSHAVCAEVYTMTLVVMALLAWIGLRWYRAPHWGYLAALGFALGFGLGVHLLILLYLPALLWLMWLRRVRLDGRQVLAFVGALLVGVSPLVFLVIRDSHTFGFGLGQALRWALFTFEGEDFGHTMFDFSLRLFPADVFEWLAFLGIQFVGLAGLYGIAGMLKASRIVGRELAIYLLLLYLGAMAFAIAYRVGDRYVFYLPSYLPFAIWIGIGLQWLSGWLASKAYPKALGSPSLVRHRWNLLLALAILVIPVLAYRAAPELPQHGITFRDIRRVPGPGSKYLLLWPPKVGYDDPRVFAQTALALAPPHALFLVNPILAAPVQFLQEVEGVRPDVTVRYCCLDLEAALAMADGRPIVLSDLSPVAYSVEQLAQNYEVYALGQFCLLRKKTSLSPY